MNAGAVRQVCAAIWRSPAVTPDGAIPLQRLIAGVVGPIPRPVPYSSSPRNAARLSSYQAPKVVWRQHSLTVAEEQIIPDATICAPGLRRNAFAVLDRRKSQNLLQSVFSHSRSIERRFGGYTGARRNKSSASSERPISSPVTSGQKDAPKPEPSASNNGETSSGPQKYFMDHLPQMPHIHRPSKEELLAAATGFWSRLKIRFKWFSIRSTRPFNVDEIGAFFSLIALGHVVWIFIGTTTFFSLAIFAVNTVFAQETLAGWIGNYLTKSSGVQVVFESAIVPKWRDGVITFKNVFVSRRPGQGKGNVSKGSRQTAVAAAAATAVADRSSGIEEEEDQNYTQFDLSLDEVNVSLSFTKWFNSKGMLQNVEVKGVRGVVDRTHVHGSEELVDPKSYRHEHHAGDFEINSFKLEDLLVTVHQPKGFRPFAVSIFSCDLPQLRRQWLFYDFLSANTVSGSFDDSLFTIHPRQIHGHAASYFDEDDHGDASPWKKHSCLRIDGLKIDHLNREVEGPFSWIHEGNVDIVADVLFPADNDESIAKVMSDFYDRLESTLTSQVHVRIGEKANMTPSDSEDDSALGEPTRIVSATSSEDRRFIIMDLRVQLNDVRAAVPLFNRDLSYINNALIRPIVAYINSRKTSIPINCRIVKRASDFDGSWTLFDSGLMDDLSAETYTAFARDVTDDQARLRRFKKVGLWSLQLAVQALFMGMAGNMA